MNLRITAGAASSFAHLLGMGTKGVRAQEPKPEDEDEEKKLEDSDVPDETKPDDEEDDQEKPDAEAADNEEEDKDDEEEDKDDDPKTRKAKANARMRERARCAAIFRSKAAATRPDLAAELAFNTGLSAKRARDVLTAAAATGAPAAASRTLSNALTNAQLADRMARVSIPNVGTGGAPASGSAAAVAQQIVAINNRRLGLK